MRCYAIKKWFPSPHSGILFLYEAIHKIYDYIESGVSVPSFGDSFFIVERIVTKIDGEF